MIKIFKVINSSRGMSIKMPTLEEAINNAIKENNINEDNIINIQVQGNSEANIIYKKGSDK